MLISLQARPNSPLTKLAFPDFFKCISVSYTEKFLSKSNTCWQGACYFPHFSRPYNALNSCCTCKTHRLQNWQVLCNLSSIMYQLHRGNCYIENHLQTFAYSLSIAFGLGKNSDWIWYISLSHINTVVITKYIWPKTLSK